MELHLGSGPGELGVDLRVVQGHVRSNELCHGIDCNARSHHVQVGVGELCRRGDPPEGRRLGSVSRLHVKAWPSVQGRSKCLAVGATLVYPVVELGREGRQLLRRNSVFQEEVSVSPEGFNLVSVQYVHGEPPSTSHQPCPQRRQATCPRLR